MQAGMPEKTAQVFSAIKARAKDNGTPTYGEIGREVGLSPRHVPARLYAIWQWCDDNGHPHLNAIVVSARTRQPGEGYAPFGHPVTEPEFEDVKDRVFAYNWDSVRFPGS